MIKLLIYGQPGTPCFAIGDRLSNRFDVDFLTLERMSEKPGYFTDKISEMNFDTGDFSSGSSKQQHSRDISSVEKDKKIDSFEIPDEDFPMSDEEKGQVMNFPCGILATEIPDLVLVDWSTHVLHLDADEEAAVHWFNLRRKCPSCLTVFHLEDKPPRVLGICDRCGTTLIKKNSDNPESVRKQYRNWRREFNRLTMESRGGKRNYLRVRVDKYDDFDKLYRRIERWVEKGFPELMVANSQRWQYDS